MISVFSATILASAADNISVKPAGLMIVWEPMKEEFEGFQTFNHDKGTHVCLGLRTTNKDFVVFDDKESKITVSDGSNELRAEFGFWNRISKDAKVMRIELHSKTLPAPDCSSLTVKGDLAVHVASNKTTKSTESRKFQKGDKVELAEGFVFEINKTGLSNWNKDDTEVSITWKRKVPELAEVRFYDPQGNLIESSSGGSSSMGFAGKYTVTKSYVLEKYSGAFRIEMSLWTDMQSVTVPVDFKIGIGGKQ